MDPEELKVQAATANSGIIIKKVKCSVVDPDPNDPVATFSGEPDLFLSVTRPIVLLQLKK